MKRILAVAISLALILGSALSVSATGGVNTENLDAQAFSEASSAVSETEGALSSEETSSEETSSEAEQAEASPAKQALSGEDETAEQITVSVDTTELLSQANISPYTFSSGAYCVLMDEATGTVLAEQNSHQSVAPASVTKIMTLLLLCEAMEAGTIHEDDLVTASANASGVGGSQIYLDEGEQMTLEDLMMSLALPSANDAAVCVGEYLCGSEEAFVERMNERSKELGMNDTHFVNPHGLDEDGHVSSAYDVALMTRQLLQSEYGRKYVSTEKYVLREGTGRDWEMINSNPLLGYYEGCIGVKTGFTDNAHYCLSAAATRGDTTLIAVCLGADSKLTRNNECIAMLDYGFANYQTVYPQSVTVPAQEIAVQLGLWGTVQTKAYTLSFEPLLAPASAQLSFETTFTVDEKTAAPVADDAALGTIAVSMNGQEIFTQAVAPQQEVPRRSFWAAMGTLLARLFTL